MRITKRGFPKKNRKWVGECRSCGAEAEAMEHEMLHVAEDPRDGTRCSWEKCPACEAGEVATGYGGMLFYPAQESE